MRNANPRADATLSAASECRESFVPIIVPDLIGDSYDGRILDRIVDVLAGKPVIEPETDIQDHSAEGDIVLNIQRSK